jgi:hypothetical protein
LQNPVGNEKLGYGWWFRCHRCNKKWWLNNSAVAEEIGPLKADRQAKIDNLSKLVKRKSRRTTASFAKRMMFPLLLFLVVTVGCVVYFDRDAFCVYIANKIEHIKHSLAPKVFMENVRYVVRVEPDGSVVNVSGVVKNEGKVVAKVKGVKITIFDGDTQVKSLDSPLSNEFVLPGDKLDFSIDCQLDRKIGDIRVEVSII